MDDPMRGTGRTTGIYLKTPNEEVEFIDHVPHDVAKAVVNGLRLKVHAWRSGRRVFLISKSHAFVLCDVV